RGARLDRCAHEAIRAARARQRLWGAEDRIHRRGADEAHIDDQRHQWLEPSDGGFQGVRRRGRREFHSGDRGCLMAEPGADDAAAHFDALRSKLTRLAYRMLGSVADAEDMVQEAFIRWMKADRSGVR